MTWSFPERSDYPDALSILDNPSLNPEDYVRLFVSSASAYFETDPITRALFKRRFHLVDTYLRKQGRYFEKALDVGCGIGFELPMLASHAKEVTALDFAPVSLEYARAMSQKRGLNVRAVLGDIMRLPFPDASYDLVISMRVLEHFHAPEKPLAELARVTKPGGTLIVGYPTETPFFHFLHETASRIIPKRRNINKMLKEVDPGEEFAAPHVSNAKSIGRATEHLSAQKREKKLITLGLPQLSLYEIRFLIR